MNNYNEYIETLSDNELMEIIISGEEDWQPEMIEAVKAELLKRGFHEDKWDLDKITALRNKRERKKRAELNRRAKESYSTIQKINILLFYPFILVDFWIFPGMDFSELKSKNYLKKYKQRTIFALSSIGLWVFVLMLISYINPDRSSDTQPKYINNDPLINNLIDTNNTNQYFLEIYQQGKLIHAPDGKMLSIIDSLNTNYRKNEEFNFIVFTKSLNGSDGFYSEGAGVAALDFITTKPKKFALNFISYPKLDPTDFTNWCQIIYGELQISHEGKELNQIIKLQSQFNNLEMSNYEKNVLDKVIIQLMELHKKS
jgi:hypothetical protein